MTELIRTGRVESFDEDKREILFRLVPYGVDARTARGYERFEEGAFDDIDPGRFVTRQRHMDPPTGRGIEAFSKDGWYYLRAKIAKTVAGDDQLTLAREGVETGASVGFEDGIVHRSKAEDGVTRLTHQKIKADGMLEASTTYIPAYAEAAAIQVRERSEVSEQSEELNQEEAASAPRQLVSTITPAQFSEFQARVEDRIEKLDERVAATMLGAPAPADGAKAELKRQVVLQIRELADVITTGNEGIVPDSMSSELLGRVVAGRPFLNNVRQIPAPASGLNLVWPKLTQGPLVGLQESEKAELPSRATIITSVDFPMETRGGAGDLSMQLLKRSSPDFLTEWMGLLGDALATDTDNRAVDVLLAEGAVVEGGEFDPANPQLGGAFTNSVTATGQTMFPDRIFLSTAAIAAFMDATEPAGGGGRPLYPGIANITGLEQASSFPGQITLRPVWVPALDDEAVDIIVGPSRAFAWAEDGSYTLQADVPAKFGRDVGVATMIFFAPLYPAAFTTYTLAS